MHNQIINWFFYYSLFFSCLNILILKEFVTFTFIFTEIEAGNWTRFMLKLLLMRKTFGLFYMKKSKVCLTVLSRDTGSIPVLIWTQSLRSVVPWSAQYPVWSELKVCAWKWIICFLISTHVKPCILLPIFNNRYIQDFKLLNTVCDIKFFSA